MTNPVELDQLVAILRDAAREEILPRFRRLEPSAIRAKTSAIDLVTEADEAAERAIRAHCAALWPEAAFVGEEGVAADPSLLGKVATADLAIVVDPIDGTANYAAGAPLFAVMASVVAKGETVAGVIYDPLGDDAMVAEKGSGAFLKRPDGSGHRLAVATPPALEDAVGAASLTYFAKAFKPELFERLASLRSIVNYRCAGHEWRLAASGHLHFLSYHKLMPWDHLAGALIFTEAGGFVRRLDGSPYRTSHVAGGLLAACNEDSWHSLYERVFKDMAND
ncbi:inositol monophosphatase family protein [Consotaella salsifontis]|uniref:Fructose-1,6-bisphosphatase n=1 Tax=Consotaella salsifontis TaxID=1365950 RepID=A0A1T4LDE4_9HYPH|nr:inositol monophosphatase [Consotaella salsifontis]SJZ52690.1 fructose-1,6-bisphosphatase [Consotaella salsifontis]